MVFVEASVVFPVMFLVILLMIYAGNSYFQKCRVEAVVNELAIDGAAYCADPMIENVEAGGVPGLEELEVYPYRFLDANGVGDTVGNIEDELDKRIEGLDDGYFSGMKPKVKTATAEYNYGFLYSTFAVYVEYEIEFPIRMLGEDENVSITLHSHASMPVSDTTELIRNVNMVEDYLEQFGVMEAIDDFKAKITEVVSKAKDWMN